ncbi:MULTISPECIES: DUF3054 domain-containing protein [unclassified Curtobacterium]|uniref:DUF3054 domain-containing protein n=1 Tax=unclassified Curtobacterium TaxID=257496 RepID=UPI000F4CDC0D|nr:MULTISPECIES: DUF3054 domain-containing protein [unclassified Curtobacterium]ROP64570.1 DUF3054 family protein [Curtobacterium sp. ZW137]TCK63484.1 DUF3054 family protein [Curtobacterium sp. PhB136]
MTDRTWGWLAAVIDVVLIVVFALIGRSSHGETNSIGALWTTAYPFLAGWAIAYVTSGAWARPLKTWPTGVVAWILTVFVGMAIRVATGQGVVDGNPLPISFLIVATVVLGVFLLGWRLVARGALRAVAARRSTSAPALGDPTKGDPAADPSNSPGVTPGT